MGGEPIWFMAKPCNVLFITFFAYLLVFAKSRQARWIVSRSPEKRLITVGMAHCQSPRVKRRIERCCLREGISHSCVEGMEVLRGELSRYKEVYSLSNMRAEYHMLPTLRHAPTPPCASKASRGSRGSSCGTHGNILGNAGEQ